MIITLITMAFWGIALFSHALLQPKFLRLQGFEAPHRLPLHLFRLVLPVLAAFLCCQLDFPEGVLVWFGSASIAGLLATALLTVLSVRNMKRLGHPDKVPRSS
ncbi:hypothetical protein [Asaia prunellae]|uniref:hypothetical protein n=1 Tax=Asaia prunellae TaxID=610245 RepID=UPI00046F6535|nr:hypothetical protein [Asaia prunellae]